MDTEDVPIPSDLGTQTVHDYSGMGSKAQEFRTQSRCSLPLLVHLIEAGRVSDVGLVKAAGGIFHQLLEVLRRDKPLHHSDVVAADLIGKQGMDGIGRTKSPQQRGMPTTRGIPSFAGVLPWARQGGEPQHTPSRPRLSVEKTIAEAQCFKTVWKSPSSLLAPAGRPPAC